MAADRVLAVAGAAGSGERAISWRGVREIRRRSAPGHRRRLRRDSARAPRIRSTHEQLSRDPRAGSRERMSGTPATVALVAAGIAFTEHPYAHDPAAASFGLEAAEALGIEPDRVFKTLLADVDGRLVVGVVPVTGKLDLKALAAAVGGKKAAMADPAVAERRTGYVVGGISPVGQKTAHPTVLDETVDLWDTVFVSGGRRGFDIELSPADLARVTGAVVAAIGTA
jgi:Cys-tRNA(Pro)/Cys-tRNA(Cys) deacylase